MPTARIVYRHSARAALLLGLLTACQMSPPAGTPVEPAVSPPATSMPTTTPTVAPSVTPVAAFVDGFDGHSVDAERWSVVEQTGLVAVREGVVELLNTRRQPDFPYMVTRSAIFPRTGAFAFEVAYQYRTEGEFVSLCLDYLPSESPKLEPLTTPLLRLEQTLAGARLHVDLPHEDLTIDAPVAGTIGEWHRLRVNFDGNKAYQVLVDGQQLAAFETTRRPEKFWIGKFPPHQEVRAVWPRLAIDEVRVEQ